MLGGKPTGGNYPSSFSGKSGRAIKNLIIAGVFIGILILSGLGLYAYLHYFQPREAETPPAQLETTGPPSVIETLPDKPPTTDSMSAKVLPTDTLALKTEASPDVSPESDLAATATAACVLFMAQFPATPCPEIAIPGIEATATAGCAQFMEQFPGTPCP